MCKNFPRGHLLERSIFLIAFLIGMNSLAIGQTGTNPVSVNRSAAISIEAQRLIQQSSKIESERAKEIALKRPIRKMVGQYGYILDFKSPRKKPTSARTIIIRQPRNYMSDIP